MLKAENLFLTQRRSAFEKRLSNSETFRFRDEDKKKNGTRICAATSFHQPKE